MKIIKKELSFIDKSNNIIFHNKYILEILSNKIGYNASFRLEEEIAGYFISSNGSNSILFEISKVKDQENNFKFSGRFDVAVRVCGGQASALLVPVGCLSGTVF